MHLEKQDNTDFICPSSKVVGVEDVEYKSNEKMKKTLLLFVVFAAVATVSRAQNFKVDFHGYLSVEAAVNTRASYEVRSRHIYLYPFPEELNQAGDDLNDQSQYDIDAARSRFGLHISGPDVGGFKTSAKIEGDFLGKGSGDSNLRLRHAYVKFAKETWSFLAGQTWHPLFLTENTPGTVNANAGAPFHPLNRSPQLRFCWNASASAQLLFYLIEQNNFRSTGFTSGTEQSMMPELDAQLKWNCGGAWAAFTAGVKTLAIPQSLEPVRSPEKVSGYHMSGSFKYCFPKLTFKMEGIYGSNLSEFVMLGGIGKSVKDDDYVSLQTVSVWTDIHSNCTDGWQPGFFAGYTANMGAGEDVTVVESLSRSDGKVASVIAFSPRIKHIKGKCCVGAEWLYTLARWGNNFDRLGVPTETDDYVNNHVMLSLQYNF
jgi:hypothetical protein